MTAIIQSSNFCTITTMLPGNIIRVDMGDRSGSVNVATVIQAMPAFDTFASHAEYVRAYYITAIKQATGLTGIELLQYATDYKTAIDNLVNG